MKVSDEILEKLTKILRLANDRAAQPGEIEAAMGKARELAMRHSIDLASVNLNPDTKIEGGIEVEKNSTLKTRSKYKQPYHYWVFGVLQEVFEVKVIISEYSDYNGGKVISAIHIIGEAVDVAIACAVYPFLEKVFPATLSRAVSAGTLTYCAAHTNGCYRGIHWGIIEANKREVEKLKKEEQQTLAMVIRKKSEVVEAAMYQMFPAMKARQEMEKRLNKGKEKKARRVQMSWEALNYGHAEGKKINLKQVGDK
jgi:hypothetical protein